MLFLLAAFGCALGGLFRYLLVGLVDRRLGRLMPWGTLLVNVLGSFLLGILFGFEALGGGEQGDASSRAFFGIGFCGGLTTFSAFSLQNFDLLAKEARGRLASNILISVIGCLAAAGAGYQLVKGWFG